jgi:hypothetical protein
LGRSVFGIRAGCKGASADSFLVLRGRRFGVFETEWGAWKTEARQPKIRHFTGAMHRLKRIKWVALDRVGRPYSSAVFPFGEFGFFGDVGRALEFYAVAVRVFEVGDPHVVADEWFGWGEVFGCEFVI